MRHHAAACSTTLHSHKTIVSGVWVKHRISAGKATPCHTHGINRTPTFLGEGRTADRGSRTSINKNSDFCSMRPLPRGRISRLPFQDFLGSINDQEKNTTRQRIACSITSLGRKTIVFSTERIKTSLCLFMPAMHLLATIQSTKRAPKGT